MLASSHSAAQNVLIVDDDELFRESMIELLAPYFRNVAVASDGVDAFGMFVDKKFDIVITDVEMPRLGGFELCALLRAQTHRPDIVIVTGSSPSRELLRRLGLDDVPVLAKPVTCARRLLEAIDGAREGPEMGSAAARIVERPASAYAPASSDTSSRASTNAMTRAAGAAFPNARSSSSAAACALSSR